MKPYRPEYRLFYFAFILFGFCHYSVKSALYKRHYAIIEKTNEEFLTKWMGFEDNVKSMLDTMLKQAMPMLVSAGTETEVSPECLSSLLQMLSDMRQFKTWAFSMMDATGKPLSGNLDGTFVTLGSYDQCLDIIAPSEDPEDVFTGQYCTVEFRPPLPPKPRFYRMDRRLEALTNVSNDDTIFSFLRDIAQIYYTVAIRYGVCVPSTCLREDIQAMADQMVSKLGLYANVTRCEVKNDQRPDNVQTAVIWLLGFFAVLVGCCTLGHLLFDYFAPETVELGKEWTRNGLCRSLCLSASAIENIKRLLNPDPVVNNPLSAMHGIRVLTMFWVILAHTYLYIDWQMLKHFRRAQKVIDKSAMFQVITNGTESVDVFFFLGGVLLANGIITLVDTKGIHSLNVPVILIRRIWRLLPTTMIMVGLVILMPLIGSGPFWYELVGVAAENCRMNWWPILVFGNNYVQVANSCLTQSWYISVDMQMFIFGILILIIFFKHELIAKFLIFAMVIGSAVAIGLVTYINGLPPVNLSANPDQNERVDVANATYFQMYFHLGPYGIGIITGIIIARHRDIRISRMVSLICWALSTFLCLSTLIGPFAWNSRIPTVLESVIHASLHRIGWTLGMAWIAIACATGNGGYITSFLSWTAFLPLSRLTFLMYLIQTLVMQGVYGYVRVGFDSNNLPGVWLFFGHLVATVLLSFICRLLFEAPLLQLERLFWNYLTKKESKQINVEVKSFSKTTETCKL